MAREIRITVDDDEVFERMKRRKRELDLSWREVLHRGLWSESDHEAGQRGPHGRHPDPVDDDIGDRLERQIKQRVEDSLERAFGIEEGREHWGRHPEERGYEDEVESLESAEDALLVFPFLDDDSAYKVPLRVELEMRAGGVDVDVVTVRQGKSVREMNAFDRQARKRIAEKLAVGTPVTLELGSGVEEYQVAPILTWSRTDHGEPMVAEVEIDEVLFGNE
jgi:hypothetical protein